MNTDGPGYNMDNLAYTYNDKTNQLKNVDDLVTGTYESKGFYDGTTSGSTGTEYLYDKNGNMYQDANKGFTVAYNSLNLPLYVSLTTNNQIGNEYVYAANGQKLAKVIWGTGHILNPVTTQHYIGNFVYNNNKTLSYILTEEGRILKPSGYVYEYSIKDHLGNARVVFEGRDAGYNLVQQDDYYPFGSLFERGTISNENKYLYNGKELQDDMIGSRKLDWYDYGARFYDPQIGRWHSVDPASEISRRWSPYSYCYNNPIRFIDPDGMVVGDFIDENGQWLGSDGIPDKKLYVLKTTQKNFDDNVKGVGISRSEAKETKDFIKSNSGQTSAFQSNSTIYSNCVEIEGSSQTRQSMVNIVNQDATNNTQEYGGSVKSNGKVIEGTPIGDRSVDMNAARNPSDASDMNSGSNSGVFHSHKSLQTDYSVPAAYGSTTEQNNLDIQSPSMRDITGLQTAPTGYVFGMGKSSTTSNGKGGGGQTVYIYNNQGVVATIPLKYFVNYKK